MPQEVGEQVELLGRQRDLAAVAGHAPRQQVELDAERLEPRGLSLGGHAKVGPDARRQLIEGERLGHVVDGTGVEACDAVVDLAARGQHDHAQLRIGGPQRLEHLDPVAAREHAVEDHQREVLRKGELERALTGGGNGDGVTLGAEAVLDEVGNRRLVFGDEDSHSAPA